MRKEKGRTEGKAVWPYMPFSLDPDKRKKTLKTGN